MKIIALKTFGLLVLLGIVFLSLIGCSPQKDQVTPVPVPSQKTDVVINSITDATGISFTLPVTSQRIISLAPAITENIKILNAQNRIVGRTDFCKLDGNVATIGNLLEPSIEKMVELNPDLVLATKDGNRPQIVERLRSLGIKVFVFGETNSWKDIECNFRICGKLLGKVNESEDILKSINNELPSVYNGYTSRVFIQLNVTPLMTAGRNTFINEIINYANGRNIAADSILPWPTLSVEEIIQRNPDVIIISDMGQITEQAKQMWQEERFTGVSAVKNKRIYVIDADSLCQPTPINFIKAVRQMREYLK